MQLIYPQVKNIIFGFFSRPFPLLDDFRNKLFLVVFSGLFATFFIYFYNPFSLMETTYDRALGRNLSIWTGGIIGSLILVFTQFFLRKLTGFTKFNVGQFILWVLFDFVCISLGIYAVFGKPHVSFLQEFKEIVVYSLNGKG